MIYIIIIIAIIILFAILPYNNLQKLSQNVKEASSNVQVAISKKLSLINQLIDTVKNYQQGEQFTLLKISEDNSNSSMMASYNQAGSLLTSIQGMADRFPNLKSSDQYKQLMFDIKECELDIQRKRQIYNSTVKTYNSQRSRIPTVFIAQLIGFSVAPYLEFDISGNDATSLNSFKTDDGERLQHLLKQAGGNIGIAAKSITNHAGQVTKLVSGKLIKKVDGRYFYQVNGGVPKGPNSLLEIKAWIENGSLNGNVKIALEGGDNWENIKIENDDNGKAENIIETN